MFVYLKNIIIWIEAATVEALIDRLKDFKFIISLWDEAATFLSSFGLYKGGNCSYDRSIILELYNGTEIYRRDLKGSRTVIQTPRYNMCLLGKRFFILNLFYYIHNISILKLPIKKCCFITLFRSGHPAQFIEALKLERQSRDDGLMQRFLIIAPQPMFLSAREILESKSISDQCSLKVILYVVHFLQHKSSTGRWCQTQLRSSVHWTEEHREVVSQHWHIY